MASDRIVPALTKSTISFSSALVHH